MMKMKIIGISLTALVAVTFLSSTVPVNSENMDDWIYHCVIYVDNTNNPQKLTDYQVLVKLDSNNFDFSQAQPDGDDLRFTNRKGDTLPYWIEFYDSTSEKARIWVKVDSIPTSDTTTIIMYCGNLTAAPASDGYTTFEFFDNFDDGDVSDWSKTTYYNTIDSSYSADNTYYESPGYSFKIYNKGNCYSPPYWGGETRMSQIMNMTANTYSIDFTERLGTSQWGYCGHGSIYGGYSKVYVDDVLRYERRCTTDCTYVICDTVSASGIFSVTGTSTKISLSTRSVDCSYSYTWFDNVRVRKYTDPEPTVTIRAPGDLSDWNYHLSITIDNTNNPQKLTDYQILVELDSGNFNFSQAQPDGDDLRFTNQNGDMLPYWIESYDSQSEKAQIWVKVDSIPASRTTTITMYYSNITAPSVSDGNATFLIFDDFSSNRLGTYWLGDTSSFLVYGGELLHKNIGGVRNNLYHQINLAPRVNWRIYGRNKAGNANNNAWIGVNDESATLLGQGDGIGIRVEDGNAGDYEGGWTWDKWVSGSHTELGSGGSGSAVSETYHELEISKVSTTFRAYVDGFEVGSATVTAFDNTYFQVEAFDDAYYDLVYMRKYTDPEPTVRIDPVNHCDFRWILVFIIVGFICVLLWTFHKHKKKSSSEFKKIQGLRNELKRTKRYP
jgi:hypothetical protein